MKVQNMDQNDQKTPFIILLTAVFVDILGFSIVLPILPFWITDLHQTDLMFGIVLSIYSAVQFMFAPIWGKISDKIGRRPVILIGLFGSALGFILMTATALFANTIELLIISRVISGIFASATIPTAEAFISDIAKPEEKTAMYGLIGAVSGIALALGPAIGSITDLLGEIINIVPNGYWMPALFAFTIASGNLLAAYYRLPETLVKAVQHKVDTEIVKQKSILSMLTISVVSIMVLSGILQLTFSILDSVMVLFGKIRIPNFDTFQAGMVLLTAGITMIIIQGFVLQIMIKKFSENFLLIAGLSILATAFFLAIFTTTYEYMLVMALPIAFGLSISSPIVTSEITKYADPESQGTLLGMNESMNAFMRVIGPLIGTGLLVISPDYPWLFSVVILVIGTAIAIKLSLKKQVNVEPESKTQTVPSI